MPKTADNESVLYNGQFRHGVDDSRRVMIPSKWRPSRERGRLAVILWPIAVEDFLLVLPPERWSAMLENLKRQSLSNEKVAAFERVLGSTSAMLDLDRFGRLALPEEFARVVKIDKEAELVGRIDKFEIWNPARCTAARPDDKKLAAEVFREITL